VANFGRDINFPVLLDETRYQWQQSISKQAGAHFFKFGADIHYLKAHTYVFPGFLCRQFHLLQPGRFRRR